MASNSSHQVLKPCVLNFKALACKRAPKHTIRLPSFSDLRCKFAKIALFTKMMYYWVECTTSSVISFAYLTHFSDLNISGTNAGICKR